MKRQRSNSIDLFDQSHSGLSPSRSSISAARSDAGDAHSVASGGAGGGGPGGVVVDDEHTRQKVLHAERMRIALQNMSEEQRERFEFFRRSHFDRDVIKKMMIDAFTHVRAANTEGYAAATAGSAGSGSTGAAGAAINRDLKVDMNDQMVIVMGALCKMFVGDLVHGARQVMDERGEEGAIQPRHLREAHRRAVKEKRLPVMRSVLPPPGSDST